MTLTVDQALSQAVEAHQSGKLQDAERLYRAILDVQPGHPDANHNLGVMAVGLGKSIEALAHLKTAVESHPGAGQFWISYVTALIEAGLPVDARVILEKGESLGLAGEIVEQLGRRLGASGRPRDEPSEHDMDALLADYQAQNFERAETRAKALTRDFPGHPFGWKVLGAVFSVTGRFEASLTPMRAAIALRPDDAETFKNIAISLVKLRRSVEGEEACRNAIRLAPGYAQAHLNLGNALIDLGRMTEAEASYREAVRLQPGYAEAHGNLGNALKFLGRFTQAEASYREAIRLNPGDAHAHNNLGDVFKDLCRLTEAEAYYRKAIDLKPNYPEARSNLLFCLNYIESLPPGDALAEARRQASAISAMAEPKFTAWHAEPDPARLRVGFVSGDLINHPVGYFAEGVMRHLDQSRFELVAFPTTPKVDDLTHRLQSLCQGWLPLFGKNDQEAASLIHQQGVHVLIDLSGHTADNRLPVFAHRPAPVQVSWLGYFATTGLPEMDYFVGDAHMAPEQEGRHFSETLWALPETWLCLTPPGQSVAIARTPASRNGFITFGCQGNLSKMNDAVIKLWARVLVRVPNSKLFLKSKQLADAQVVAETERRFAARGVSADRLILEGPSTRADYFEAYNRIDMVLDTFPYPGGTTSVDALWMGVPVLTLEGDRFLSRLGESIARNALQSDWIARGHDDYVEKAAAFAADLEGLAARRETLRDRVLRTPLFDTRRFAGHFGDALWGMWNARAKA